MFLKFENDLDNLVGGSSSEGDNSANGRIPMTIAPGEEKLISPYAVHFSQGDCHRHFKKYRDPEEARANPPNILVRCDEDWHFLCDHYMSRAFQEQSRRNKAAKQNQPYNYRNGLKSFLQHDKTSLLSKEGSRLTVWSCSGKHTFNLGESNAGTLVPAYSRSDVGNEDFGNYLLQTQRQHWKGVRRNKVILDALFMKRREMFSRRISSDDVSDVAFCVGKSYPDVFSTSVDVCVHRESPQFL
ncbi:CACTA en-spm transposon protein [Cucumis melo var. makuwa]|uniref:CACTA en-spm transposon protein n=1 Tax=Cucumis melo var. makuwa TaxID=1194695 RepID=A0A5A7VJI4_CUCMM|nr:CACTA en-spm transposon protein [Cucumis melo var. makuwa]TYK22431.1 CACTA en-spm transposon protein [Cucumis melo var. makuwa]